MTEIIEQKEQGSSRSQPVLSPKSDTAGDWVKWGSGPCPVEPETLVDIRLGASEYEGTPERELLSVHAKDWGWDWKFTDPDIIAWRLNDGGEADRSGQLRDEKSPSPIETEQRERVVAAATEQFGAEVESILKAALADRKTATVCIMNLFSRSFSAQQQENERLREALHDARGWIALDALEAERAEALTRKDAADLMLKGIDQVLPPLPSQGGEDHVG